MSESTATSSKSTHRPFSDEELSTSSVPHFDSYPVRSILKPIPHPKSSKKGRNGFSNEYPSMIGSPHP